MRISIEVARCAWLFAPRWGSTGALGGGHGFGASVDRVRCFEESGCRSSTWTDPVRGSQRRRSSADLCR